ncbi:MAG: muconolactone Delta-isomerase family protein [Candidatus Deferrimicrobiaceae bacterium]
MQNFARFMGIPVLALIATVIMGSNPPSVAAQGDTMLYLVEFEATEAGAPTTRDQAIELLDKLVIPTLEKLAKDGRIRAGGLLVGARAGAFVVAAKSHDEVTELVRALPSWGVMGWKVTPLESFAHRADLEKKVVQELRAQK